MCSCVFNLHLLYFLELLRRHSQTARASMPPFSNCMKSVLPHCQTVNSWQQSSRGRRLRREYVSICGVHATLSRTTQVFVATLCVAVHSSSSFPSDSPMKFSSSFFACLAFSAFVAFMSFLARFSEDLVELELEEALSSPFSAATRLCLLFRVGSGAFLSRLLLDLEVFDLPAPLADGAPQASLDFLPCSGADS